MKTAHCAVGTEVAAAHIKSPCRSCWVMTNTGRLFSAFKFENGNGIPTRSPGLKLIPDIIFFIFPNLLHHRLLSFFKRFNTGIPVGTDLFNELEYLSCQRLWKISCFFTNYICDVHTSPFRLGFVLFRILDQIMTQSTKNLNENDRRCVWRTDAWGPTSTSY